ncbi:MAG: sensor histidine kinase [Deltaproteobacteria bacterium]|nr:MAG: sensor histidine kinase [Deltaproteobacteria bacterium]
MSPESIIPVVLQAPVRKEKTWAYPWIGVVLGIAVGIFIGHPLAMLAFDFHNCLLTGKTCDVSGALYYSFAFHMWPMMLLFSAFGGISWGILGYVLKRLRENRLRLDNLHQEFEFQVATLRHHYKNLALGIHGFSNRIQRKIAHLDETFSSCLAAGTCPSYEELHPEFESLKRSFGIVEDAAQRLIHTLGQEVLFLKALTGDTLTPAPKDFYPFLIHCIEDLKGLRFQDKELQVRIDGCSCKDCRCSLVFPFEPYTMEVILQNIIGNAMKYADQIQVKVREEGNKVVVEIEDNGPGLDVEKLRENLLLPGDRREADSTHLGIKVTLHLLEKAGGRLSAWSRPGAGAKFIIEFPRHVSRIT